jgi:hypothetical protein
MSKITTIGLVAVGATICVALGTLIGGSVNVRWNGAVEISSVDLVTIILTALGVMLAILTIFLAVFGFIGWTAINERLREHSMSYFTNELQEGKPSYELLRSVVRSVVYEGISPVPDEEPYSADPTDGEPVPK